MKMYTDFFNWNQHHQSHSSRGRPRHRRYAAAFSHGLIVLFADYFAWQRPFTDNRYFKNDLSIRQAQSPDNVLIVQSPPHSMLQLRYTTYANFMQNRQNWENPFYPTTSFRNLSYKSHKHPEHLVK